MNELARKAMEQGWRAALSSRIPLNEAGFLPTACGHRKACSTA